MPYITDGDAEIVGFGRRSGGGNGGGWDAPARRDFTSGDDSIAIDEVETGRTQDLGVQTIDGEEYDVIGVEYDVIGYEVDPTSGRKTGRSKRMGTKVKRIMKRRQNARARWEAQDGRLEAAQRNAERQGGMRHQDMSYERQGSGGGGSSRGGSCGGANSNTVLSKPLATSASFTAAQTATLTLTPQYASVVDKFVITATLSLPPVIITNVLFGVEPLYSNPEATSGWGADAFGPTGTLGDFVKGKQLVPQTPVKVVVTNGHTATQTVSVFIKAETSLGSYANAAA